MNRKRLSLYENERLCGPVCFKMNLVASIGSWLQKYSSWGAIDSQHKISSLLENQKYFSMNFFSPTKEDGFIDNY